MKLPEFDRDLVKWDQYKRFHIEHGYYSTGLVQFETGELIMTRSKIEPDYRGLQSTMDKFDIMIVATIDTKCPRFTTPDGVDVLPSWLDDYGMQLLVVDLETKHAVRADHIYLDGRFQKRPDEVTHRIPVDLRGHAQVYFAGPGSPPVGNVVSVTKPRELPTAYREHVRGIKAACLSWSKLADVKPPTARLMKIPAEKLFTFTGNNPAPTGLVDFDRLSDVTRWCIIECGISPLLERQTYPYLLAKI